MFWKLLAAPRWIVGGCVALVAFLGYGIGFKVARDVSWTGAALIGVVGGATVALATVVALSLRRRELRAVDADRLSPSQQGEAYRAVQRGQLPPDPEILAAALRIADHRVKGAPRQRKVLIAVVVLLVVSAVLNLIGGDVFSFAFGCVAVLAVGFFVLQLRTAHRRAADLVSSSAGDASSAGHASGGVLSGCADGAEVAASISVVGIREVTKDVRHEGDPDAGRSGRRPGGTDLGGDDGHSGRRSHRPGP